MTYDGRPSTGEKTLAPSGSSQIGRHFYVYRAWVSADRMESGDWPALRKNERVLDAELISDEGPTFSWRLTILVDPA